MLPEGIILAWPAEPARSRRGRRDSRDLPAPIDRGSNTDPPGTLERGDVLRIDATFYAGQSERTNAAGTEQLRQALGAWGYDGKRCRYRMGWIR